jgi:5-methylcytosine-specific restriction protein B
VHERELELRRQRFVQIQVEVSGEADYLTNRQAMHVRREEGARAMGAAVTAFISDGELDRLLQTFGTVLDGPGASSLWSGLHGAVCPFLEDLRDLTEDEDTLTGLLADVVRAPDADGVPEIDRLVSHVQLVRQGSRPSQRDAVTFLSLCWWLQLPAAWPVTWSPVQDAMRRLGWLRGGEAPGELYRTYRQTVLALGDQRVVEDALTWFGLANWTGLDRAIPERLAWALELYELRSDEAYPDEFALLARTNIEAVLAELRVFGDRALTVVASAVGRTLKRQVASTTWVPGIVRADGWVKWRAAVDEAAGWTQAPSIWLTVARGGVLLGFHPGRRERGWVESARERLLEAAPSDLETLSVSGIWDGRSPNVSGEGEFVVGRWYPDEVLLGSPELLDEVERIAVACQPIFDVTMQLAGSVSRAEATTDPEPLRDDPLWDAVRQFRAERGNRNEYDEAQRQARVPMAAALAEDALDELNLIELGRICNSSRYGSTGSTNPVRAALAGAGPNETARIRAMVCHLLWGEGAPEDRLDRCLDNDDLGVAGFGEAPLLKLLAVARSDQFLPLFRLKGERGKLDLIKALGLTEPPPSMSRGARHVATNDVIRRRLDPFFPDDLWGQAEFAVWYRSAADGGEDGLDSRLDDVVERCWMEGRGWIDEVVDLLGEKRQIVFYGPPGTGKTFIAQALAEAIAPDSELRRLVQFHPSTSYEDFFEGYRPSADASGNLSYSLQQGPFAELADHAAEDSRTHVLIIDELNRANVPKVLGELLFLLEYRDESVVPLYRPEGFQLPENLWLIATMNTADRSIASLDAALRRRFHFVPIFPHLPPVDGLLQRFLVATQGDSQWADLVEMVNEELRERFGNSDLLIGPSHFMNSDLDENRMDRIWRYDIEPFLEDQFFGDQATIERFRWRKVLERHRAHRRPDEEGGNSAVVAASPDGHAGDEIAPAEVAPE